jgi:hypothetical protein
VGRGARGGKAAGFFAAFPRQVPRFAGGFLPANCPQNPQTLEFGFTLKAALGSLGEGACPGVQAIEAHRACSLIGRRDVRCAAVIDHAKGKARYG